MKLVKKLNMRPPKSGKGRKKRYGLFVCECGALKEKVMNQKIPELCISCKNKKQNSSHGKSNTKLYQTWKRMKTRCSKHNKYAKKNYYDRGICVCEEWNNDFLSFFSWAINNGYKEGLTIDRINNDGNYEPSNCRWVSMVVQNQNSRSASNKTGYKGVKKVRDKYEALIMHNGRRHYLGLFSDKKDAAIAYNDFIDNNNTAHIKNVIL